MLRTLLTLASALLLLSQFACGSTDEDGDGFSPPEDCNDQDATIFPGATELPGPPDSDCDGGNDPTNSGGDDDDSEADPGELDTSTPVTGDWSCYTTTNEVPTPGETAVLNGEVLDFAEDDPVYQAQVQLWPSNDPSSSDGVWTLGEPYADAQGLFEVESGVINACSAFAARVWTNFDPQETYPSYQVGLVVDGSGPFQADFVSVSYATYNLIQLALGVDPVPGKGIAAGRMKDCNGDPIANAEITVGSLDRETGTVTDAGSSYKIRYFVNEDPNPTQPQISDDGLFGAMDLDPGQSYQLLAWGVPQDEAHCWQSNEDTIIRPEDNEGLCLLGSSTIYVQADSVNISNIQLKPYPDSCFEADAVGR